MRVGFFMEIAKWRKKLDLVTSLFRSYVSGKVKQSVVVPISSNETIVLGHPLCSGRSRLKRSMTGQLGKTISSKFPVTRTSLLQALGADKPIVSPQHHVAAIKTTADFAKLEEPNSKNTDSHDRYLNCSGEDADCSSSKAIT